MPTESKVYEDLTRIFHDVFMRDDIVLRPNMSAKDVAGWDSFKQIEIILAVESHFGIKVSSRELDTLQVVGDLVRVVMAKSARP